MSLSPELLITALVNLCAIGASYVGLRVQFEHRMTRLETHLDMILQGTAPERRQHD